MRDLGTRKGPGTAVRRRKRAPERAHRCLRPGPV